MEEMETLTDVHVLSYASLDKLYLQKNVISMLVQRPHGLQASGIPNEKQCMEKDVAQFSFAPIVGDPCCTPPRLLGYSNETKIARRIRTLRAGRFGLILILGSENMLLTQKR